MAAAPASAATERAVGLMVALVGFLAAAGIMADNSLLTHLATGHLILDGGRVPDLDPYSRFGADQAWTVQSWLVSVAYAVLDDVAGTGAIRAFHGLLGAVVARSLWTLTRPLDRSADAGPGPAGGPMLIARIGLALAPVVIGIGLWSPRPLLVGLVGLALLLVLLRSDRPAWLAVPLLWTWANSHGSFPLASGLLVLIVLGYWLDHRRLPARPVRLLGWTVLGTILAVVGPLGVRVLLFPLGVVADREAMAGVVEWEPPTLSSPWELAWLALGLLPVLAARRGVGWERLLPAIVFVALGALALRNVAPASIVVVALLAPRLVGQGRSVGNRAETRAETPGAEGPTTRADRLGRAVGLSAAVALVVAVVTIVSAPGLDLRAYPVSEIERLEQAGVLPDDDIVVVHREAVGNYLIWRHGAEANVFVDDRFDFHQPELLADHRDLVAGQRAREILDRWQADVVLWQADGPLAPWLVEAPEWVVEAGERWLVACRIGGPAEQVCADPITPPALALPSGS